MIFIFIWVVFGVIGWKMASDRGRSEFWGAISGLFFGIFTILYYLIVGDSKKKRNKELADLVSEGVKREVEAGARAFTSATQKGIEEGKKESKK